MTVSRIGPKTLPSTVREFAEKPDNRRRNKSATSCAAGVASGRLRIAQLRHQPGLGVSPIALGSSRVKYPALTAASSTDSPRRIAASRDWAACGSSAAEFLQGLVNVQQPARPHAGTDQHRVGGPDVANAPPCLGPHLRRACSTRIRRIASAAAAKKWPRLFQCWTFVHIHEPEIRLMHQRRRLQRLPRLLLSQLRRRQLPQLVIDQRQKLLRRRRIARFDLRQDAGDVGHGPNCD